MKTSHPAAATFTAALTATALLTGVLAGPGTWHLAMPPPPT